MERKVNVSKSKDKRYHHAPWIVRWRSPDGRRHFRSFVTKGRADEYARMIHTQINAIGFTSIRKLPWGELREMFIQSLVANRKAAGTIKIYQEVFDEFGNICQDPPTIRIAEDCSGSSVRRCGLIRPCWRNWPNKLVSNWVKRTA